MIQLPSWDDNTMEPFVRRVVMASPDDLYDSTSELLRHLRKRFLQTLKRWEWEQLPEWEKSTISKPNE